MLFYTFKVGDKEYKCRLTAQTSVELEKKLGENPLTTFAKIANANGQVIPRMEFLLEVLHSSMVALNHGISLNDTYVIYDEWADEGHTLMDLVPVILEIFKVSGYFKEEPEEKNG